MAFEKVDPKVDFPAQEREVLALWERTGAFESLREINRGKPKWSFLDGPITANNPMGVHHAWGRTYKDVYQRYHASLGRELRYQNGFDCQGLWVEVEVEKEHGFTCKRDIEAFGIDKFVEECKARARKFAAIQTEQSKRLGYWMDWDNSYYTMSDENNYGIWGFLKKCHEKGLLYKGVDVMPWCPRCGTGLSQMEMNEGYREVPHTSVFVRFPIRERKGEYLLVWTTTPWTLSSNVAAAVKADMKYVKVRVTPSAARRTDRADGDRKGTGWGRGEGSGHGTVDGIGYGMGSGAGGGSEDGTGFGGGSAPGAGTADGTGYGDSTEYYYIGKANFENARSHPVQQSEKSKLTGLHSIQAMFKGRGPFEVVEELRGEALVGLSYDGPFDMLAGAVEAVKVHRVIEWEAVTESEGTGIVHIAPGCGSEDYHLGRELGLPQIAPLFEDGRFRPEFGFLAGKRFDEVADEVASDLKNRGILFNKEQYYHRYPHCWRCKDELVYRLVDEWFINMNWREQIMESARQARWVPSWGLERELDWLKNMGDWMISKKRYWGLALPIWECHACGHFEVMGGYDELRARAVAGWEQFEGQSPHRPWVDAVKLCCSQCGDTNMSRVKDVGNPWLDASIVPFSTMGYFSDRKYWEQWFPADFVVEALPGQFRNWFYALLAVSTMMVERSPFKVLKGHGLVLDDVGKPMHKSDGNAIWFEEAAEQFGVDVMRWLYAATSPERNVLFGPKHCDETRREMILPWWNVYAFFCNLARVDEFDPAKHTVTAAERSLLDQWILSDLNKLVRAAHEAYSNFDVGRFCAEALRFIDVLSTWYVRRSRRRFYGQGWPAEKRAAYATLYEVLITLNRIIAPIVPFMAETVYQNLSGKAPSMPQRSSKQADGASAVSVHHTPFPEANEALIDEALSTQVAASLRVISLARSARKEFILKVRQPLAELVVVPRDDTERRAVEMFADHFLEELNVKRVSFRDHADDIVQVKVEPNMKTFGPKFGRQTAAAKEALSKADARVIDDSFARGLAFNLSVDGAGVALEPADVAVKKTYGQEWAGAADGKTVVLLDRRITPALRNEGHARDIVRNVQNLRKEAGLDIADRIVLGLVTTSKELTEAIAQLRDYIAKETLAVELLPSAPRGEARKIDVDIEGQKLTIALVKAI